jgi:GDP-mannose transporter
VYACLALMLATAAAGALSDAAFSAAGYAWQLLNCLLTAAYALYLSRVTQRLSASAAASAGGGGGSALGGGSGGKRVGEATMAYWTNLLSIPLTLPLVLLGGEAWTLASQPALRDAGFQVRALGFGCD